MRRVGIYSRVSTTDQKTENQTCLLREIVEHKEWELIDCYVDHGVSGAKGRENRPEFDRLCKDMVRRRFDAIMVWDVSRLSRSLHHLIEFLNDLQSVGCDLYIHQQGLDTSTPAGRMMFQMVGVFSEFERAMISERIKAGLARVKANGKKLGRPISLDQQSLREIMDLHVSGASVKDIAAKVAAGRSTVYRVIHQNKIPALP